MHHPETRARRGIRALGLLATVGVAAAVAAGTTANLDARPVRRTMLHRVTTPVAPPPAANLLAFDSLIGRSGKLRALFVSRTKPAFAISALEQLFGDSAVRTPGVYTVNDSGADRTFALITMLPFSAKRKGRIGEYRIGYWPYERHPARSTAYADPDGFIEVTPDNQETHVSEHFELRDFLTHDQQDVWPKYLVLDERLIDKLELVIEDLNAHGVPVTHLAVMSGFRTPQYNIKGVGEGGRARDSRHQYGDAADVFVDDDGNGRMDDLNHDGRIDWRDARVIRDAVDRVEAAHPELVGGVGLYRATAAHGPFAHVDARGNRARWGMG